MLYNITETNTQLIKIGLMVCRMREHFAARWFGATRVYYKTLLS